MTDCSIAFPHCLTAREDALGTFPSPPLFKTQDILRELVRKAEKQAQEHLIAQRVQDSGAAPDPEGTLQKTGGAGGQPSQSRPGVEG